MAVKKRLKSLTDLKDNIKLIPIEVLPWIGGVLFVTKEEDHTYKYKEYSLPSEVFYTTPYITNIPNLVGLSVLPLHCLQILEENGDESASWDLRNRSVEVAPQMVEKTSCSIKTDYVDIKNTSWDTHLVVVHTAPSPELLIELNDGTIHVASTSALLTRPYLGDEEPRQTPIDTIKNIMIKRYD